MANPDVKYLNKDFSTFKQALVDYAKSYYPTAYNDFSTASPGTMFIDMAAYVGDVLSFYLDNQIQESFLEYAKQESNLYAIAYMLGYRPKVTSAAVTKVYVYQQVPSKTVNGVFQPDYSYALTIEEGMRVQSNTDTATSFYLPEVVDFTRSSSYDPTDVSIYTVDSFGRPDRYLLRKSAQALSGDVRSTTLTFGQPQRFQTATLSDSKIIEVLSVVDSATGDRWYEVPYLAQDYVLESVTNTAANYPDLAQYSEQVPYVLKKIQVPKRFTTRFQTSGELQLEFGAGINNISSSAILPDPFNVGIGTINGLTMLNTAYDPTNYVTTEDYGLAPNNTTLTVTYLAGGGATANVQADELTVITSYTANFRGVPVNGDAIKATIAVTNPEPATGGGDGDDVIALRQNTAAQFPSQLRAVTQQDYLGTVLSMPSKFGQVAKAYVTKDENIFRKYNPNQPAERDPLATTIYLLSYTSDGKLEDPAPALFRNVQTYLEQYRMLTDVIYLRPAYIINIGVTFDIVLRPDYTSREVIAKALADVRNYFNINNWQVNQPIILAELYTLIDKVQGVQTVQRVEITNQSGENNGYSKYSYDIPGATLNGIIYPSLDPSIFEVKYPDIDIQGRVVTTQ